MDQDAINAIENMILGRDYTGQRFDTHPRSGWGDGWAVRKHDYAFWALWVVEEPGPGVVLEHGSLVCWTEYVNDAKFRVLFPTIEHLLGHPIEFRPTSRVEFQSILGPLSVAAWRADLLLRERSTTVG